MPRHRGYLTEKLLTIIQIIALFALYLKKAAIALVDNTCCYKEGYPAQFHLDIMNASNQKAHRHSPEKVKEHRAYQSTLLLLLSSRR